MICNSSFVCYLLCISSFTLCLLATVVLCYYLRRRYLLALDIKNVSECDLRCPDSQNELKNLKLIAMICNFVIVIIIVEIMFNLSISALNFPKSVIHFLGSHLAFFTDWQKVHNFFLLISIIGFNSHISIVCLLLKVLWLAYLHCPYKNTIIRWSGCIALRCTCMVGIRIIFESSLPDYRPELSALFSILFSLGIIVDFVLYLVYSRRFYLQLKSREIDAKLPFDNEQAYLSQQHLSRHFKVASFFVAIAYFFLSFPHVLFFVLIPILSNLHSSPFYNISVVGTIIYSILFSVYYLYLLKFIVVKYVKQKRGLIGINRKIKLILTAYHKKIGLC